MFFLRKRALPGGEVPSDSCTDFLGRSVCSAACLTVVLTVSVTETPPECLLGCFSAVFLNMDLAGALAH